MTSTYLSYLTFERTYGRPLEPVDTSSISLSSDIASETRYFANNIGKVSTGKELVADRRLFEFAMTAFGLKDQIDNPDLIAQVLDEGIFDPFTPFTAEQRAAGRGANPINELAEAFWFSEDFILPSIRTEAIDAAVSSVIIRYAGATQGGDQAKIDAEIDYFRNNAKLLTSGKDLVANERLFRFVRAAFDIQEDAGNGELIAKALDAGVYNPGAGVAKQDSLANTLQDSRFRTLAQAFAFNELGDQNTRNFDFVNSVVARYEREALEEQQRIERERLVPPSRTNRMFQRDIDYFRENIAKATSVEALLADERLYRFVMTAYDLESQISSKGLIRKVLEGGVADEKSLANTLIDKKFRELAAGLGYAEVGDRNVRNPNFAQDVIDRFARAKLESNAGEDNIGVRLAAYFDRKGPGITSWFSILGDRALREVAFTAFDFPNEMQQTDPDKLARLFEQRMNVEDFKDPEKRAAFIKRFTLMYDIRNGAPGTSSNTLALYGIDPTLDGGGGSGIVSIDPATLGATLF